MVALRKESVDRNKYVVQCRKTMGVSLSARRAWIEMRSGLQPLIASLVALRKESVDRNLPLVLILQKTGVALRKESVDRNLLALLTLKSMTGSLSARRAWIEIQLVALC